MDILVSSGSVQPSDSESAIYCWRNHENGKQYVGQSLDTKKRIMDYPDHIRGQRLIYKAMSKYGLENFSCYKVMDCCPSKVALNYWETYWIKALDTLSPNGYNLRSGGGQYNTLSEESRKKMSLSHKGKAPANKGKKMSDEFCKKISEAKRNPSVETRHKMSMARVGKTPWNKGKKGPPCSDHMKEFIRNLHTDRKRPPETGQRISAALKGKKRHPHTEEWKRKISEIMRAKPKIAYWKKGEGPNKGRKFSAEWRKNMSSRVVSTETRAKLREANLGKKHSPETIAKMKLAHARRKLK